MGLDMYLERWPRYKGYGVKNVSAYENFRELKDSGKNFTLKEWCGADEADLPLAEDRPFFDVLYKERFYAWDTEHRWPTTAIGEQVAYWRKANAVHKWFVDHVQDGEDDCEYHREVTREDLEELRNICKELLENVVMVNGQIENGQRLINGKWVPIMQEGKRIVNPEICRELLPTETGFFFGGTDYDEYYLDDIKHTWEACESVLSSTDFENQMIFYRSSW